MGDLDVKSIKFLTIIQTEEAFTSENWLVRIYQVKEPDFLGRSFKDAIAFDQSAGMKTTF